MTELERLAAVLVTQWRSEGGHDGESIAVSALLDRVLPYRVARRSLGIDINEDYEALMLRLLSEEEGLVRVMPPDAAALAAATSGARLPDLSVLQLLRSATVMIPAATVARLADRVAAPAKDASPWAPEAVAEVVPATEPAVPSMAATAPAAPVQCWSCSEMLPTDRQVKFCPFCGSDQRQPVCRSCGAVAERGWKHCPDCGGSL